MTGTHIIAALVAAYVFLVVLPLALSAWLSR